MPAEKSDAIITYLSFNLARCHLKSLLGSLLLILDNLELSYNFLDLSTKIDEACQKSLRKTARSVKFTHVSTKSSNTTTTTSPQTQTTSTEAAADTTTNEETNELTVEPAVTSTTTSITTSSTFTINTASTTCYNMLLAIEKNVTLTSINLKLKLDSIGIRAVIVILIFTDETPTLASYTRFDNFDQEKFRAFKLEQTSTSDTSTTGAFDLCYFDLYDNQLDLFLQLSIKKLSKHVLIKFLKPKEATSNTAASSSTSNAKPLNLSSLSLLGYKHESFELYEELKKSQHSDIKIGTAENVLNSSTLVNKILWFLCELAEQRRNNSEDDSPKFLDFEAFEVNDLWGVYEKACELNSKKRPDENTSNPLNLNVPVLILMHELVRCSEIKSNFETDKHDESHSYKNILDRLFEIIDKDEAMPEDTGESEKCSSNLSNLLKTIAKEILKNGIWIFFPSEKLRKEFFLSMVEANSRSAQEQQKQESGDLSFTRESTKLLFEAFCNLFTTKKHLLIQHFVKTGVNIFENETSSLVRVLNFIENIIDLTFAMIKGGDSNNEKIVVALCDLLSAIQSFLFFHIKEHLVHRNNHSKEHDLDNLKLALDLEMSNKNLSRFLTDYIAVLIQKCEHLASLVLSPENENDEDKNILPEVERFFKNFVYQSMLWLSEIFADLDLAMSSEFLKTLVDFHQLLARLQTQLNEESVNIYESLLFSLKSLQMFIF